MISIQDKEQMYRNDLITEVEYLQWLQTNHPNLTMGDWEQLTLTPKPSLTVVLDHEAHRQELNQKDLELSTLKTLTKNQTTTIDELRREFYDVEDSLRIYKNLNRRQALTIDEKDKIIASMRDQLNLLTGV